jgi:uncharacterized membrane protein
METLDANFDFKFFMRKRGWRSLLSIFILITLIAFILIKSS